MDKEYYKKKCEEYEAQERFNDQMNGCVLVVGIIILGIIFLIIGLS